MKTKLNFLAAGIFLTALGTGFGQPPIITQQPQSCARLLGTTATFTVGATGTEPLAYQWQKRDYLGKVTDLADCTNTTMVLANLQSSQSGDYRVVVTNVEGVVTSQIAKLTLVISKPRITSSPQHLAAHLGTNASFAATASGLELSYQWRLDGRDLPGKTANTLSITNVQPADEGDYTLAVANLAGAVTSESARLWVVPPASALLRRDFTNGTFRYPYYYLIPTNYNPARSYPLVCIFHGGYGDEITFTNGAGGPPGWVGYANYPAMKVFASYRQQATDPAIVVFPTVRAGDGIWPLSYVEPTAHLLDSLIAEFNIDTNRVYISGGSAGVPPTWSQLGFRPGFFASAMVLAGPQSFNPAASIKDVPFWAFCAKDDETNWPNVQWLVHNLRAAGGNPIYTEYQTGGHLGGIWLGLSTPVAVDWMLAQRRGVAPTNEPLLSITNPTLQGVLFTGATNLNLAGVAAALDRTVTRVTWTNFANNANGIAAGTNFWTVTSIPLVAEETNVIVVVGTTSSWAPTFGGNTTFNDTLTVIQSPIRAALTFQGSEAMLNWAGGGPPYRVQRATDLATGDWRDYLTDVSPPVSLSLTGHAGFYRVVGQ